MDLGPRTVRPDERLTAVVGRMVEPNVTSLTLTTSDGRLVEVLRRVETERRLGGGEAP